MHRLPAPYEDELLYSVIARHILQVGLQKVSGFTTGLFATDRRASADLPAGLDAFCRHARVPAASSPLEVLETLTLFPFYAAFLEPERRLRLAQAFLRPGGIALAPNEIVGVCRGRLPLPATLRLCTACRDADLESLGETYWRRSHQLAGVSVCSTHGAALIGTNIPFMPRGRGHYFDAGRARFEPDDPVIATPSIARDVALAVARRCREFLQGDVAVERDPQSVYRSSLMQVGYSKGASSIDVFAILERFTALGFRVGHEPSRRVGDGDWLRLMLRRKRLSFPPHHHAAMQVAIHRMREESGMDPLRTGPWWCPNPYAGHDHPTIGRIELRARDGSMVAKASCDCGHRFSFRRTIGDRPVVHRTQVYGKGWEAQAKWMRVQGMDRTGIAMALGVSEFRVKRLLSPKVRNVVREDVDALRGDWLAARITGSHKKGVAHASGYARLDRRLRSSDPRWRGRQLVVRRRARQDRFAGTRRQIDWAARDRAHLALLQATSAEEGRRNPGTTLSKYGLVRAAGLGTSLMQNLHRLPRCDRYLRERVAGRTEGAHARRLP